MAAAHEFAPLPTPTPPLLRAAPHGMPRGDLAGGGGGGAAAVQPALARQTKARSAFLLTPGQSALGMLRVVVREAPKDLGVEFGSWSNFFALVSFHLNPFFFSSVYSSDSSFLRVFTTTTSPG